MDAATSLHHRLLLDDPAGFRPFDGTSLFDRIGGQSTVDRLVDELYDGFDSDDGLRPLFPADLAEGRAMQKLFFAEWFGGPSRYSDEAHAGLANRHDGIPITRHLAGHWLWHFQQAMEAVVADAEDRRAILAAIRPLARALVNDQMAPAQPIGRRTPAADQAGSVAWCGIPARTLKQATDLAHAGDVRGLRSALLAAPDLLRPGYSAAVMQAAVLAGRTESVQALLDAGAGVDHPLHLPVKVTGRAYERVIFVTPLCAARMKKRSTAEALLVEAGAREDVFTSAFLGDIPALAAMLDADDSLALVSDPAVDVLDITPLDHAVAGGQVDALRLILDRVEHLPSSGVRALRSAAEKGNVEMVTLLLEHGANAERIGAGRWVLHPELAPLLAARGATVGSSGSWIGASCTGNQGRKDDPEFVNALLRHGAQVDDRRTGAPGQTRGIKALHATALHFAAKSGFVDTVRLLLDDGADPAAVDSQGRTPLDWVVDAAPTAQRTIVGELLTTALNQ